MSHGPSQDEHPLGWAVAVLAEIDGRAFPHLADLVLGDGPAAVHTAAHDFHVGFLE
jgi:hypothetical protein